MVRSRAGRWRRKSGGRRKRERDGGTEGRKDGGRGKRERREAKWEEASCLLYRNLVQPALLRFLLKP